MYDSYPLTYVNVTFELVYEIVILLFKQERQYLTQFNSKKEPVDKGIQNNQIQEKGYINT